MAGLSSSGSVKTRPQDKVGERSDLCQRISALTAVKPAEHFRAEQLARVPRSYQLELAELAKAGNALICLDTGCGKTLISVFVLQHVHGRSEGPVPSSLDAEIFASRSRKVSFFLVNLVPLVHQQASAIASNSELAVGMLYGELKEALNGKSGKAAVDNWRAPHWSALLESHQVIVSTAQCFLDALIHGFIKMQDLNRIIFDEVHHALKNHPFSRIMTHYRLAPSDQRPKILGMTASPIFSDAGRFHEASSFLQKTMDARIHTVSRNTLQDLEEVKQKPEELVFEYDPYITAIDNETSGVALSPLSQQIIINFGAVNSPKHGTQTGNEVFKVFEKEVRPKIEYTLRNLGPLACDVLWHSMLFECRAKVRKWAVADDQDRLLVSDAWIAGADMSAYAAEASSQPFEDVAEVTTPILPKYAGSASAVAHVSTNAELNQRILQYMRSQPPLPDILSLHANNASPKLLRLIEILHCFEPEAAEFCGIIFVERRQTATLLVEIIKRVPGLQFIHPEFLLGHEGRASSGGTPGHDWQDQVQILNRFRQRQPTNLLIATSIAEEGLDIQAANVVIRFDLFNRHISYLQSRGRARARDSRFILMAESGNQVHAQIIFNAYNTEQNRHKWLEDIGNSTDVDEWCEDWTKKLQIEVEDVADMGVSLWEPTTGARLFPEDALPLISHYASTRHSEHLKDAVLAYETVAMEATSGCPPAYNSVLQLPSSSPVRRIESGPQRSKKQAKRMAAFKACQELRHHGELDEWLMPRLIGRPETEHDDDSLYPIDLNHKKWRGGGKPVQFPSKKMDGWARFCSSAGGTASKVESVAFYATYLALDAFDGSCQPLLLLTSTPLPQTDLLCLFCTSSKQMQNLRPRSLGLLPPMQPEDAHAIVRFTKRIFQLMTADGDNEGAKDVEPGVLRDATFEPAVLVVPVRAASGVAEVRSAADLVFDLPGSLDFLDYDFGKLRPDELPGRVLVRRDDYASSGLFKIEEVRRDLQAHSLIQASPPVSSKASRPASSSAPTCQSHDLQHCVSRMPLQDSSEELAAMPLLLVTEVAQPKNLLSPQPRLEPHTRGLSAGSRVVVPCCFKMHPLPASVLSSVMLLPSILTRYDQLLLASSCNFDLFDQGLHNDLMLTALTVPSAESSINYERLEFLGDAFLKMVATCHTFTSHIGRTEAELHIANKDVLTNERLYKEALRLRLARYAIFASSRLDLKRFLPPMIGISGGPMLQMGELDDSVVPGETTASGVQGPTGASETGWSKDKSLHMDVVKKKALPDIVEAIIGAALQSTGTPGALHVCRKFGLIPDHVHQLRDFNSQLKNLKAQSTEEEWHLRVDPTSLKHLQRLFDHTFQYPHLALEAFTHPSLLASILPSYQRLKFLGDACIDFFIVRHIFAAHPDMSPGELTALKAVLASKTTLAALGHSIGLHRYIASNSSMLCNSIEQYAKCLDDIQQKAVYKKDTVPVQYWTALPSDCNVPKAIGDVLEASFASIFVDCGFDENTSQDVFRRIMIPFYQAYCQFDSLRLKGAKRMVDYLFATVRRAVLSKTNKWNQVMLKSSLADLNLQMEEEDKVVEAWLSEIWVELKIGGKTVGGVVVLAKSPLHLERAVAIWKEIVSLQDSIAALMPKATFGATEVEGEAEAPSGKAQHENVFNACTEELLSLLTEHHDLILRLARVLEWRTTYQCLSPLGSRNSAEEAEEKGKAHTLAHLRKMIFEIS